MSNLILSSNVLSMSSKEIAELTGSRHDVVKRTIDTLVKKKVIIQPQSADEQIPDIMNRIRTTEVYIFIGEQGRRDSIVVVAQLCPEYTAKIVDRWQELELLVKQPIIVLPDFTNPILMARTWADNQEAILNQQLQLEQKQKQLEVAKPKVDYFDDYVNTDNLKTVTMTGKEMGVSSQRLGKWFRAEGYAFKDKEKGIIWTQPFINKGYGVMKQFSRKDGGYSGTQAYLTPNGEVFVKANYEPVQ